MNFRPTQLTFMLTNGCNSRCRHCITNSGGKDSDELELSKLGEVIANIDVDICIDLTGGEPFTEEKKIEAMISAKGGSVNAISTNGFWGETERSAKFHLAWLYEDLGYAGMLILSTGEFHVEFVSLDSIRNIVIVYNRFRERRPDLPTVRVRLDNFAATDSQEHIQACFDRLGLPEGSANIHSVPTAPDGRAADLDFPNSPYSYTPTDDQILCQRMPVPFILPNGLLQSCMWRKKGEGVIGDLKEQRLSQTLRNFEESVLFGTMYSRAGDLCLDEEQMCANYYGPCDFCTAVLSLRGQ